MVHGICHLSVVPCRKEPSDRSELVTQLLFGELVSVLEQTEKWVRIHTEADRYECWVDPKQLLPLEPPEFSALNHSSVIVTTELVQVLKSMDGSILPLVMGSTLPAFENGICRVQTQQWTYEGQTAGIANPSGHAGLIETALMYLHAPYLWGGRSPFGIDCSGFVQMVYRLNGYALPRDAYQQATCGNLLSFIEEAEAGDLAFFDNAQGNIIHVGIILNGGRIIHASGCVRIDRFDHQGIFHSGNQKYSHNLRMIRKII